MTSTITNNVPTITLLIIGHGKDLVDKKFKTYKNIRELSRAGMPGCLGVCSLDDYENIINEYKYKLHGLNSSYEKLLEISEKFLTEQQCSLLYDTTHAGRDTDTSIGRFSKDIFSKKNGN